MQCIWFSRTSRQQIEEGHSRFIPHPAPRLGNQVSKKTDGQRFREEVTLAVETVSKGHRDTENFEMLSFCEGGKDYLTCVNGHTVQINRLLVMLNVGCPMIGISTGI